ncbi:MAG: metallophosphoesterase family protein [Deltaproteobacteria bacterium]|nr:metallophosphoesterase family protein [Deltaproteobacteria bacterium]
MILAFLSDVHGNLPALRSALADADARGAEKIYCAGDLTGYGPFPSEVCSLIARRRITTIIGNYDAKVLAALARPSDFKGSMKPGKWRILDWTCSHLDLGGQKFLSGLPESHRERLAGGFDLLMVHGSPLSPEDTLYPSLTSEGLKKKLAGERPDILVCGHTHIPFVKRLEGILVVNCGAAGHPVDGDPRPAYALVKVAEGKPPAARIIRFDYAKEEVVQTIEASTLPRSLKKDFLEGNKKREVS